MVLKNRSNKIRSNEIRIRQELPAYFKQRLERCMYIEIVS